MARFHAERWLDRTLTKGFFCAPSMPFLNFRASLRRDAGGALRGGPRARGLPAGGGAVEQAGGPHGRNAKMPSAPSAAVSHIDPFCDEFLADPYPFHEALREAGPVVWLERYGIYASARHAAVQAALPDWQTFSSAAGVGIDDFRRSKPWRPPSPILEAGPPLHTRTRTVLNRVLSAKATAGLRDGFTDPAEQPADGLVQLRRVDPIAYTPEAYPPGVFPRAVGLGAEGLENLLPY